MVFDSKFWDGVVGDLSKSSPSTVELYIKYYFIKKTCYIKDIQKKYEQIFYKNVIKKRLLYKIIFITITVLIN